MQSALWKCLHLNLELGLWQVRLWRLSSNLCSPGFRQPTTQEPQHPPLKALTFSTRAGG